MKPTLIIADDMESIRQQLIKGLQGDFEILAEAQDGIGAVEACLRHQPQLCLLDVIMPKCTGIAAAKLIRAEMKDPPKIILLSAVEKESVVRSAFEAGVSDYLFKPLDMKKIVAVLWACARESDAQAG